MMIAAFIWLVFFIKNKLFFILVKGFLIGLLIFNFSKLSITIYEQYFNEISYNETYVYNKEIRNVIFKQKPNIHIFFFDALSPDHILKKQMDIHASYNDVLRNNYSILKNIFADGIPTIPTMNWRKIRICT